ncbi:MAG: hypothetical protein RIT19_399 [Verrucomicrobiota bacterium]|jgi:hypothetical protein
MTRILHILANPSDPALERLIADQTRLPDHEVIVHRLEDPAPDYRLLLEQVFAADSVECW